MPRIRPSYQWIRKPYIDPIYSPDGRFRLDGGYTGIGKYALHDEAEGTTHMYRRLYEIKDAFMDGEYDLSSDHPFLST